MASMTNLRSQSGRRSPEDEAQLEQAIARFCSVARAADQQKVLGYQIPRPPAAENPPSRTTRGSAWVRQPNGVYVHFTTQRPMTMVEAQRHDACEWSATVQARQEKA